MALKVLVAGCSKDERELAEAGVRKALGPSPAGAWTVSLVKIQRQWSVSLDGPGCKANFVAPEGAIRESILEAVKKSGTQIGASGPGPARAPVPGPVAVPSPAASASRGRPVPVPAPIAPSAPGEQRDRSQCQKCGQPFVVTYVSGPGSGQERVAVACPHCWHVNHVMIAEEAAWSRDYRAEKA